MLVHWLKALAPKPDGLFDLWNLNSECKERTNLHKLSSDLHKRAMAFMHAQNKKMQGVS